jgi:hypothetical protein
MRESEMPNQMTERQTTAPQSIDPSTIPGWGIDADPENDPTYPMRDVTRDDKGGMNWQRPAQQEENVEVLQSIERNAPPAVFGTSTPPSGVSGMLRRQAFKFSESDWTHWLMLMAADRVNVVEGVIQDLGRGHIPNIPGEMGLRSELAHNKTGLMKKVAVTGAVIGLGLLAAGLISRRGSTENGSASRQSGRRSGKSTLQKNAEKALKLKQEAGPQTQIPEHRTSHQGGVQGPQVGYTDTMLGKESTYTSNLKRSHNARTGDA